MIYDFIAKITNIKNDDMLYMEEIDNIILEIHKKFGKTMNINILLSDATLPKDLIVKAQASVSSLSMFHNDELINVVSKFKNCMEEIAIMVDGEVSKSEGFYNNSKTFHKLY